MAIDRAGARRRVRAITGWAAAGAAALTTGFAFGASRGDHAAKATATAPVEPTAARQQDAPQQTLPQPGQGFAPPSASSEPPAAMSGGS